MGSLRSIAGKSKEYRLFSCMCLLSAEICPSLVVYFTTNYDIFTTAKLIFRSTVRAAMATVLSISSNPSHSYNVDTFLKSLINKGLHKSILKIIIHCLVVTYVFLYHANLLTIKKVHGLYL
jgi:hypothetical protein